MLRRLRLRFIAISLLSMILVLFTIISAANYVNYRNVANQADGILTMIADNDGQFPNMTPKQDQTDGVTQETKFESRYFSVVLTKSGSTYSVDTSRIAAVDKKTAVKYAKKVLASKETKGFLQNYRFLTEKQSNGQTAVYFLDCGRSLENYHSFFKDSFLVSLSGVAVVFALIVFLSKMAMIPAIESYKRQHQFITDAGHEIKTPLTVIDADITVIEMENGESEWCDDIRKQVRRLTDLTNRLIQLSKLEEGSSDTKQHWTEMNLSEKVQDTAQSFQSRAKVDGKTFTLDIQPNILYTGDETILEEMTSILLDNALKYSPEGGSISLSLKKERRDVQLVVENTTDTVNTKNSEHLFDRFYRDDSSHNSETGGYGIGLSIAKAAAEIHHGKISSSSRDGHSLTMTVTLK